MDLTPKEIEAVGNNRYLRQNNRLRKALLIFSGSVVVGGAITFIPASGRTGLLVAEKITAIVLVLLGFAYYWKVVVNDSVKAGKKFLAEWNKEKQS